MRTNLFLILLSIICFIQCAQPSIHGDWKPKHIKFIHPEENDIVFDLSSPNKLEKEMFQRNREINQGNEEDSIFLLNQIQKLISNFSKAELSLKRDNKYILYNYNLIITPDIVPGLHISDTIIGNYKLQHDTLILLMNNELFNLDWKFKIKNLTLDSLAIQDITIKGTKATREILFEKK